MATERKAINELVPGQLYQRGQILTWPREDKVSLVRDYNLGVIVNLWPKIDPDLAELSTLKWYFYVPTRRSADVITSPVLLAAEATAKFVLDNPGNAALILCEAGKTRSVFFAAIVMTYLTKCTGQEAYDSVTNYVTSHKLKPGMTEFLVNWTL